MDLFLVIEKHYAENYKKFVKTILRRAGSWENAEDIVQESYSRALQYTSSYDQSRPFDGWFITILNNTLRRYKSDERKLGMSTEYEEERDEGFVLDDWAGDLIVRISQDIHKQPDPYRDIYRLYFLKQYTPREIVMVLDVTSDTVRSAVKRFKKVLEVKYGKTLRS